MNFAGIGDLIAPMSAALGVAAKPVAQGNWLTNLFSNKAFLQLLGAAGTDISGGTGGKNTIAALTSLIGSQNFMKRFGDILGAGGDVKITSEGAKINIPAGGAGATATATAGASGGAKGTATPDILGTLSSVLGGSRPFSPSQTDVPVSDLAGLDPQTLAQGMGLHLQAVGLEQEKVKDLADAVYKQGLLNYYQRQTDLQASGQEIDKTEADTARLNAYQKWVEMVTKDERTELQKNFEQAREEGFNGKIWEFKAYDETGDWFNYTKYRDDEKAAGRKPIGWEQWLTKHETTRAPRFTPFETKMQTEAASAQSSVMAPDFFTKIQEELSKDKRSWRVTEQVEATATKYGVSEEAARTAIQKAKMIDEADKRIRQAFKGQTVTEDKVGWYVDGKLVVRKP